MSGDENVPAWKKKLNLNQIKAANQSSASVSTNDSLKVVKHLSTDSILSKKDKKDIINQQNKVTKKRKDKAKRNKVKITDRLVKEDALKSTFLRDQLRYLIEYYIYKYSVSELPDSVKLQENVKKNMDLEENAIKTWKFNKNKQIWLLKNCFAKEGKSGDNLMIPKEYDTILVEYFINLPSESTIKKDLIERSWKILHSWNDGIAKQREHMMKMLEEEPKEKENDEEKEDQDKKEEIELPHKDIVSRAHEVVQNLDKTTSSSFELEKI